jgi:hypothetical protein
MSDKSRRSWIPPELVPAPSPSMAPLAPVGLEASWEETRADAERVDPRDVTTFKGTATVVLHNVRAGVDAVLAERPWFEAQDDGPKLDFARVASATTAAEALVFTAARASRRSSLKGDLVGKVKRARKTLTALRAGAEALVAAGIIDEVPASAGRGPTGVARDCVTLASLFRTHRAKTRHVTAVTPAFITEAATLGTELLSEITPKGAPVRYQRTEAERAAADDRDRVAAVVTARYHYVERAAGWRWGSAAAEHVPAMLTRELGRGGAVGEGDDDGEEEVVDEEDDTDEGDDEATDGAAADEPMDDGDDATPSEPVAKRAEEPATPAKKQNPRSAKKR